MFEKLPAATLTAGVNAAVIELVDIAKLRHHNQVRTHRLGGSDRLAAPIDLIATIAATLGVPTSTHFPACT